MIHDKDLLRETAINVAAVSKKLMADLVDDHSPDGKLLLEFVLTAIDLAQHIESKRGLRVVR